MQKGDTVIISDKYSDKNIVGRVCRIHAIYLFGMTLEYKDTNRTLYYVVEKSFVLPYNGEAVTLSSIKTTAQRIEIDCSTCKRKNDFGVKTCWCCGNKP